MWSDGMWIGKVGKAGILRRGKGEGEGKGWGGGGGVEGRGVRVLRGGGGEVRKLPGGRFEGERGWDGKEVGRRDERAGVRLWKGE